MKAAVTIAPTHGTIAKAALGIIDAVLGISMGPR